MKYLLVLLYLIALLFGIFVLGLIFDYNPLCIHLENKASLLSAIGIVISAYIASFSVIMSINNTKNIEKSNQLRELKKELNILHLKTSSLHDFLVNYYN